MERAVPNLRDKLLIRMLFRPGCRVSELGALGEENVDLAHGVMTIVHLKSRIRLQCPNCQARLGRTHAFCPGCGAKIEGRPLAREQEERRQRVVVGAAGPVVVGPDVATGEQVMTAMPATTPKHTAHFRTFVVPSYVRASSCQTSGRLQRFLSPQCTGLPSSQEQDDRRLKSA